MSPNNTKFRRPRIRLCQLGRFFSDFLDFVLKASFGEWLSALRLSHDPLLSDNFSKCIFAVPSAADDCKVYFAMVWWHGGGLDNLHDVFPDTLITWVSLCPFNAAFRFSSGDMVASSRAVAHCSGHCLGGPRG